MNVCALLCVLGALLKGEAKLLYSRASVEEGRTLILRCAFPESERSDMQWRTPRGYVTFLNSEKVLKDRRFQVIKSSRKRLVMSVSNITGDDEGVYTCLHYSMPVKTKEVNVTVWAAPSDPVIEVAPIPGKSRKGDIVLNCSTSGGRPCPRITWLVGHTELSGNRKVTFEGDDKKCAASSTLRINAFSHRSTVTCVVRHRGFSAGNSTATFNFSDLLAATKAGTTQRDQTTAPTPHSAEVTTSVIDSQQSSAGGYDVTTTRGGGEDINTEVTSVTPPERRTAWEAAGTDGEKENTTAVTGFTGGETSPAGDNTTQRNETTETVTPSVFTDGNSTQNTEPQNVTEINCSRTGGFKASRGKSNSTVILILVSLMMCVLLVIVHLFLMKLRKAHESWKKDNENSDQTLESNKSKSNNEDAPGPARNGHAPANQNGSGIKYNTQVSL